MLIYIYIMFTDSVVILLTANFSRAYYHQHLLSIKKGAEEMKNKNYFWLNILKCFLKHLYKQTKKIHFLYVFILQFLYNSIVVVFSVDSLKGLMFTNLTLYVLWIVTNYINKPTRCTFCVCLFYNFCTTLLLLCLLLTA